MKHKELILYRELSKDPLFERVTRLIWRYDAGEMALASEEEREQHLDEE